MSKSHDAFMRAVHVSLTHAIRALESARRELESAPPTATPWDVNRAYALLHEARDEMRLITAAVDVRATAQPSIFPEGR